MGNVRKTNSKSNKAALKKTASVGNTKSGKAHIKSEEKRMKQSQIIATVIFAFAVFLFFLTVIPGGGIWMSMRAIIFGLFGGMSYFIFLILFYLAIAISLDTKHNDIVEKVIEASSLIVLICSAVFVYYSVDGFNSYWKDILSSYLLGDSFESGGAIGAAIGGLFILIGQRTLIAGILIGLFIFVDLMFLTGTTIAHFYRGVEKPVKKVKDIGVQKKAAYDEARKNKSVLENENRSKFNVDVPLGPGCENLDMCLDENSQDEENLKIIPSPARLDDIVKRATDKKSDKNQTSEISDDTILERDETIKNYVLPLTNLLNSGKIRNLKGAEAELKNNAEKLVSVLSSFGVQTKIVDISMGPSVTRYELAPAAGVKISKITGLSDDIALNMAAQAVRIEAPIPGKAAVGIEIPNKNRDIVMLREILEDERYKKSDSKTRVSLGRDITGNVIFTDVAKMPHLLIAGTTGSGKSVCLNGMIMSILYNAKPDEVKLVMIDPKQVEFTVYNGIPHLLIPVVSDPKKASGALSWAVKEMLNRYKLFSDNNVRDIKGYNKLHEKNKDIPFMPSVVIFIDELSDLMMAAPSEVEDSICRLAQMARAAGMHLIIATQSPRADVITGIIKANIPSRISLSVSSALESRIILDEGGAEKLIGYGDMLFNPIGNNKPVRIQGCNVSDKEIRDVVSFIKSQETTEYDEEIVKEIEENAANIGAKKSVSVQGDEGEGGDELLSKAIEVVVDRGEASTTLIQRKLKVGYARAARIIDELEERNIIGPYEGSKPRKLLISKSQWLEMNALSDTDDFDIGPKS